MPEHHPSPNSSIRRIAAVLACTIAVTLCAPPRADAQDAFSCIEELSDEHVRYRIRYITEKLDEGKKQATRWRYTWMGLWLAGGAAMTYAAFKGASDSDGCPQGMLGDDCRDRNNASKFAWAYLAAGAYFVGLSHAFIPAPGVWGAKRIRRQDDSTEEARRAQLRYATNT